MDYTSSNGYATDAGTGNRMHTQNQAIPTMVTDTDLNGLIWSLMEIQKAGGVAAVPFDKAVPATYTGVIKAIKRLCGGNVRVVTAAGATVLTADDAGLVLLDATANAIAITLPAVNAVTGAPLLFEFVRIDSVLGNAVTVARAGADTFVGGGTSFSLTTQGDFRSVMGDSASKWATTSQSSTGGQQAGEVTYFARKTAPTGFLKANGAAISRSTYAVLFAALCATGVVTTTISSPCTLAWPGNTMEPGERFRLTTTGALPTGLTATSQDYYVSPAGLSVGVSFTFSNKQRTEFLCSMSIATPGVVTTVDTNGNPVAHGLVANEVVVFDTTGALPTNAVAGTPYFVSATGLTANTFQFSTILGGASVATSGTQSGTHLMGAYGAQINTSGAQNGVHTATAYPFGAGDGTTTFNIPELRGEFVRGLDDGRLINPRRVLGSNQADELKSHNHQLQGTGHSSGGSSISFLGLSSASATYPYIAANGGIETRPRNVALLACIKF